ncbi:MarR family winged helix-turn-helix transcriptional regulator [Christensenellaceae bacterium OttesenSCG-928-M15]|nr:MarR family winged helix-turn-helix transcriptional regulator [Christensenellaceae bacterium OttesenSCG-928-M15]
MEFIKENTDIIDLISEKHGMLRSKCEQLWNEQGRVAISTSEWYVLSRIYGKEPAVSEVQKHLDISRQGIHKCLHSLQEKGIVRIIRRDGNRRDTFVSLTPFGEDCYEQYTSMKLALQQKIAGVIGEDGVYYMRELLKKDWFAS